MGNDALQEALDAFREEVEESLIAFALLQISLGWMRQINDLGFAAAEPKFPMNLNILDQRGLAQIRDQETYDEYFRHEGGGLDAWVGQAWVVRVYSIWDSRHRKTIGAASGEQDPKVTVMGDLRWLRHDVAHYRGVARQHPIKILTTWATPGYPIRVSNENLVEFMDLFPWSAEEWLGRPERPSAEG